MIIKGGSRSGPGQLAAHLQRVDTNERVAVLELHSGSRNIAAAFRDWQALSEGTRGVKGLYHVNIDPDARYTMTPEQWTRAVDVLEKELGLECQPRCVVMHEKHGREHVHVVWCRTNIETMKMWDDGYNYVAHERASWALEEEFGHEHVPGKHAKRDREKQPEFPRAKIHHDDAQQAERAGVSIEERRAELAALVRASDSGTAFVAAAEEAGYIVANGDRRTFVIVDQDGAILSLGREMIGTLTAKELKAFMSDVDRDQLPNTTEAVARQRADRALAPSIAPEISDAEKPAPKPAEEAAADKRGLDPLVKAALEARQAEDRRKWGEWHAKERGDLSYKLDRELKAHMALLDERQAFERENLARQHKAAGEGIWERLQRLINPALIAERLQERRREAEQLTRRQAKERKDQLALEHQSFELELEAQAEEHAAKMRQVEEDFEKEELQYLADQERAEALLAEIDDRYDAEEEHLQEEREADEDYAEEERLERERNPWDDDPLRRSK